MAIEVKQMRIKSTVLQQSPGGGKEDDPCYDADEMKSDILAECRRLIVEILREKKER